MEKPASAEPKARVTPAARSLALLRELGYLAQVVERFNHHVGPHGVRQDLFGVADIEALAADHTLYVQATPASTLAAHVAKCTEAIYGGKPAVAAVLACPSRRFEIWSWALRGARGKRKLWTCRRHRAIKLDGEDAVSWLELAAWPVEREAR